MKDYIMPLALAIIGSGSVFGFIQFLINRRDTKKNSKLDKFEKKLDGISLSQYRTEMLVMMNHYQDDVNEIMRLAQHYFLNGGDFYMTSLFAKWLKEHKIEKPMWFDETK